MHSSKTNHAHPIGVSFQSLGVHAFATPTDYQKTFGNFPFAFITWLASSIGHSRKRRVDILRGCDGLVKAGEMLLVLGRPGSGCSTLLKTLAGETYGLQVDDATQLNYQGIPPVVMHSKRRGECIYQAEIDIHFPTLTVNETVRLAAVARAPSDVHSASLHTPYVQSIRDSTLSSLGLCHTLNTKVGNAFLPGISGGERRRLSGAEVLVCSAKLHCWDNSTRGLDSANALEFVRTLRAQTKNSNSTAIVTLYQASEDIFEIFDKVLLLRDGHEIYFGSRKDSKSYFTRLGFVCPQRMTTADFLTSLANPLQRVVHPGHRDRNPNSASEFADIWNNSTERTQLLEDIREFQGHYPLSQPQGNKLRLYGSPYTLSILSQIRMCTIRGFLRLRNDLAPPISGIIGNFIVAVILGSVYYNLPDTTGSFYGRTALIFFTTLLNAFITGFEPGMLWEQRPIVEKHYRYALYHPYADAIGSMVTDLPNKILLSICFNVPVYFLANLRRTPEAFFTFWLFSFSCLLTMSMVFRTLGSWSSTLAGSIAPGAILVLLLMIYTGFTLPTPYMHPWLRWFNYLNPVGYTFESLMINEFHNRNFTCSAFVPEGPTYSKTNLQSRTCNIVGSISGSEEVSGDAYIRISYQYSAEHLWRNLAIIFVIMVFACCTHLIGAEYQSVKRGKGEILLFRNKKETNAAKGPQDEERGVPVLLASVKTENSSNQDLDSKQNTKCAPTARIPFFWNSLSYEIKVKDESRRLLDDIEGWIKPGSLTALMGASGAGKTTLLNVLAQRASTGVVFGETSADFQYLNDGFARNIGYAQQQDIHLPTSTVREALRFSALLRQPTCYSRNERLQYVEDVIQTLDMEAFADAIVGVPGEGLNIEQRKRLTIGVELAARPELLLFLDEPTSGLDSDTAWSICSLLRKLVDDGQTILCTIHQPSATLFQMFDKLLFLAPKGKSIYFGDIGPNSATVIRYFEEHGAQPCGKETNPAEWLLNCTNSLQDRNLDCIDWAVEWHRSEERRQIKHEIESMKKRLLSSELTQTASTEPQFSTSFIEQLYIATLRLFGHNWRTPSYLYSKLLLSAGSALCIGFSFWMSPNSIQGVQNQVFAVFLLLTTFPYLDQQIISQFTAYREIYELREAPSRTYSWLVFMLSNILVEIPWQSFMSVFLFAGWYYPIGMYKNGNHTQNITELSGLVFLLIWSFMLFVLTIAYMVAASIESTLTAINITQLLYSLSLIFCGILAAPDTLPRFWIFMYRVSPVTYFISALISAAVGSIPIDCEPSELLRFEPQGSISCGTYMATYLVSSGGTLLNPDNTSQCQFCPFANTNEAFSQFSIKYRDRWWQFAATLGYSAFNIVAALLIYWAFRVPKRPRRNRKADGARPD